MRQARRVEPRLRRHRRVRKKVRAPPSVPRLAVFRSNKHIVAQVIDDRPGAPSPPPPRTRPTSAAAATGNVDAATKVGAARRRAGQGRRRRPRSCSTAAASATTAASRPLADAAREAGLEF